MFASLRQKISEPPKWIMLLIPLLIIVGSLFLYLQLVGQLTDPQDKIRADLDFMSVLIGLGVAMFIYELGVRR